MLDVSIVLFNSARWLPALVESLCSQSVPLNSLGLLVQDNGSIDHSADTFERLIGPYDKEFRSIHIQRGAENIGFGRGHNAAIANGVAPFVCVLNPDSELRRDALGRLLEA